jgi:HPt (histidine-containing phosphotransfer) domain-containing protein
MAHGSTLADSVPMMNEAVVDSSVIDMLRGLRMDGEPDPLVELSNTFALESATRMRQLSAAVETGDYREVRRAAHVIKGMSATIGALHLSALSKQIERAEAGAITDARLDELEVEIERVSVALTAAAGRPY